MNLIGVFFFLTDYIIATQGLMSVGLAVCLIALLVSTLALCCQCNNCNYTGFVAGLLITACKLCLCRLINQLCVRLCKLWVLSSNNSKL